MANADQIIELLHEARARPAGTERDRFLDGACGDDVAVKELILSLLAADAGDDGSFLKLTRLLREPILPTEKPGDRIGRYKLLEHLGEGGCGAVFMAEQEEPVRRRVALKVIKLGMDTQQVIARFEAERQALAMMDHPNIAKVLDGGTTEAGRPYFVMELVRGTRITDYCDENNLPTNERLELFMQVCHAIQHAHQKGIIHRDIKPSNILVTEHDHVAVPKIIDFGIAKATTGQLTDKTVFTAFAQFIGTPAYMSPEQAQMTGLDVDTRSDIYSLGVLLYELLTGHTPFDAKELLSAGMDEMRRKIREDEPAKPSTRLSTMEEADLTTVAIRRHAEPPKLIHQIRGDLDWLVMKCLEKDRTRRYDTANGLAMDVQRHLDNEPVIARPPSTAYRFQKLVRRNKVAFVATTAVLLALLGGIATSTWQAIRATHAEREQTRLRKEADAGRQTAQTEAARSEQVARFMKDMLNGVGPSAALGRDTAMLREILDKTVERMAADLKDQPNVEAELRNAIGAVYWELGEFDKASAMHLQALAMQRRLLGDEHPSIATSLHHLAQALREQGRLAGSAAAFRESLAMRRKLLGNEHPDVAQSLNYLGSLLSIELKDAEPESLLRESLAIRRKLHGNEHRDVATSLDNLAHVLNRHGQTAEAVAMHHEALAIRKRVLGDRHPELIYSYRNLAGALKGQGKLAEAEAMTRDALLVSQKLLGQQHPDLPAIRLELGRLLRAQGKLKEAGAFETKLEASAQTAATSLHEAGKYFQQQGKLAEAEANYREALALRRVPPGDDHREIGITLASLGEVLHQERKLAEAEAVWREELAMEKELSGNEHPFVANSLRQLAAVLRDAGKSGEAEVVFREALDVCRRLSSQETPALAASLSLLGEDLSGRDKPAQAEEVFREVVTMRRRLFGTEHVEVANALSWLAKALADQAKYPEAEAVCLETLALRRKIHGNEHAEVANALSWLAGVLADQAKNPEAETVYRELLALRRKLLGDEHREVADTLQKLGLVLSTLNKQAEAETAHREALAIRRKLLGREHTDAAHSLGHLTIVLRGQGKLAEIESLLREELADAQGPDPAAPSRVSSRVAVALHHLADVLRERESPAEARPLAEEAWALYQQHPDWSAAERGHAHRVLASILKVLGDDAGIEALDRKAISDMRARIPADDGQLAAALAESALHLYSGGKYTEAEPLYRETLVLRRKAFGNEHSDVAMALTNLANVLTRGGKLPESETTHREALAMRRKLFGREHLETSRSLNYLTSVLSAQGKLAEAEALFRDELVHLRGTDGDAPSQVSSYLGFILHHLADMLRERQALDEARALAEEACALYERHPQWDAGEREHASQVLTFVLRDLGEVNELRARLPADDPQLAGGLAVATANLLEQKKFAEAEQPARECLLIREKKLPDNWRTFNARSLLGASLLGQRKFAEAEPLLLSGYGGIKQREDTIPPASKRYVKETLQRVVQLYESTSQPEKLAEWKQRLAEFDEAEAGMKTDF